MQLDELDILKFNIQITNLANLHPCLLDIKTTICNLPSSDCFGQCTNSLSAQKFRRLQGSKFYCFGTRF